MAKALLLIIISPRKPALAWSPCFDPMTWLYLYTRSPISQTEKCQVQVMLLYQPSRSVKQDYPARLSIWTHVRVQIMYSCLPSGHKIFQKFPIAHRGLYTCTSTWPNNIMYACRHVWLLTIQREIVPLLYKCETSFVLNSQLTVSD